MTQVLVASAEQVERLLSTSRAIAAMERAFRALATGSAVQPLRMVLPLPTGAFFVMPAGLDGAAGVKALTYLPANAGGPRPVIQGLVTLFDTTDGRPLAILDAASLTAIRTAAASGLATRFMARFDAHVLAVLGAGIQARTHIEAMCAAREVREIRVWSRSSERARTLVRTVADKHQEVRACDSVSDAVRGADIVCCVTSSPVPVVASADLADGVHVNAVGAHTPTTRELDGATMARARLVVDARDAALAECGEIALAVAEGAITRECIAADLAEVVTGRASGRTRARDLTVFKSLGLAVEDVAAAMAVLEAAREDASAQWVTM
ncbi:MAG: ornithine cyclodeaminase family protein [Gemmatimonadetes bacterium]|nr:ornithine cyclodeaminase family protein [Gemmatimonadota bacterium]